jgi:hypothetical protein
MGDYGDWIPTSDAAYQAKLAGLAEEMTGAGQNCAVWGVSEVEGKQAVYNALASALHTTDSTYTWTVGFVLSGDSRNITQGFLWRNDVTLVGSVTPVSGSPFTGWVTDGTLDFVRTPPTAKFRFLSISRWTCRFTRCTSNPSAPTPRVPRRIAPTSGCWRLPTCATSWRITRTLGSTPSRAAISTTTSNPAPSTF